VLEEHAEIPGIHSMPPLSAPFPSFWRKGHHRWCDLFVCWDLSTFFYHLLYSHDTGYPLVSPYLMNNSTAPHLYDCKVSLSTSQYYLTSRWHPHTNITYSPRRSHLQSTQPQEHDTHNGKIALLTRAYDLLLPSTSANKHLTAHHGPHHTESTGTQELCWFDQPQVPVPILHATTTGTQHQWEKSFPTSIETMFSTVWVLESYAQWH